MVDAAAERATQAWIGASYEDVPHLEASVNVTLTPTPVPPVASGSAVAIGTPRGRTLVLWLACVAVALSVLTGSLLTTDSDAIANALSTIGSGLSFLSDVRWTFVAAVLVLATAHYVAAAVSLRAAGGVRTRLGETMLVQFAAATANRLSIGGLGGGAVNARYLSRQGLCATSSVGAVTALGIFGGFADMVVLSVLVLGGTWLGIGGSADQVTALRRHISRALRPISSGWLLFALIGVALVIIAFMLLRRRGKRVPDVRELWRPVAALLRQPSRLFTMMSCSAATTLVLGLAFAASVAVFPGTHASVGVGGLVIAYMLGGAAGNASALPSGIGATEAALTALLVADHVPASRALQVVLFFRVLTFWLPAAIGLAATRYLVRRRAL
jgi:uncharacterized membrane protein YbhN (UPF0104 family)